MLKILLFASTVAVSVAEYPTSFPFENEELIPPPIRAATPSWKFDEDDPGGYVYTGVEKGITEDMIPYVPAMSGLFACFLKASSLPPVLSPAFFNCTKGGHTVLEDYYSGGYGSWDICEPGECCKEWIGLPSMGFDKTSLAALESDMKSIDDNGACSEGQPMPVYCYVFSGGANRNCVERYVTPTERTVIGGCFDGSFKHYFEDCKVYKVTGFFNENWETAIYFSLSTVEESTLVNCVSSSSDKICHPYSYYYPSTSTSSTSTSSKAEPEDNESSTAVSLNICVLFFAALFFVV